MSKKSIIEQCREDVNKTVPVMLMASYLYYCRDLDPPLSDQDFDQICKLALDNWKKVKHPHKRLIKRSNLEAGSLYNLVERKYPLIVRGAALLWYDLQNGKATVTNDGVVSYRDCNPTRRAYKRSR